MNYINERFRELNTIYKDWSNWLENKDVAKFDLYCDLVVNINESLLELKKSGINIDKVVQKSIREKIKFENKVTKESYDYLRQFYNNLK